MLNGKAIWQPSDSPLSKEVRGTSLKTWASQEAGFSDLSDRFLLKKGHPRPLFRLFLGFFKQTTIITNNQWYRYPSSIRRRDSNPRPLEHESSSITTIPGLPPSIRFFILPKSARLTFKFLFTYCIQPSFLLKRNVFYLRNPFTTEFHAKTCTSYVEGFSDSPDFVYMKENPRPTCLQSN